MGGTCSTHGEMRNAYKISAQESEDKRPSGRPMHEWKEVVCALDSSGSR
jgi:hypothetical protein